MKFLKKIFLYFINRIFEYHNTVKKSNTRSAFFNQLIDDNILKRGDNINITSLPIIKKHQGSILVIGNNCTIHSNTQENFAGISHPTSICTMHINAKLKIGNHVGMSGTAICCAYKITIGNYVNIGTGTKIYDTDWHPIEHLERRKNPGINLDKIKYAEIIIGDDVWTGANVIILKGVSLGKRVIVAAGSVVTKSFPDDVIIAGNPARIIKRI